MKCMLVGFFNSPNLGDILIADSLYSLLSSKFSTIRYSYSGNPNIITDLNHIKAGNTPTEKSLKVKAFETLKKYNITAPMLVYRKLKKPNYNLNEFQRKLNEVDCLVIGGGNMIFTKDKFSTSASRFNEIITIAKNRNKKVFAISLGIGPFQTKAQEELAIAGLKKCDFITFRDQKSYNIYAKHVKKLNNVFISVDPVFSLPYLLKPKKIKNHMIGLNIFDNRLIDDSELEYKNQIKSYISLVEKLVGVQERKVVLFSTDLKDYESVKEVYKHFRLNENVEIREITGFNSLLNLYQETSLLIASRMHSMIIAYTQLIPVIGLSWQPKVEAFFEIIKSEEDYFEYNEINNNLNSLINLVNLKLNNIENEEKKIQQNLYEIKKKRQIDEEILKILFEK